MKYNTQQAIERRRAYISRQKEQLENRKALIEKSIHKEIQNQIGKLPKYTKYKKGLETLVAEGQASAGKECSTQEAIGELKTRKKLKARRYVKGLAKLESKIQAIVDEVVKMHQESLDKIDNAIDAIDEQLGALDKASKQIALKEQLKDVTGMVTYCESGIKQAMATPMQLEMMLASANPITEINLQKVKEALEAFAALTSVFESIPAQARAPVEALMRTLAQTFEEDKAFKEQDLEMYKGMVGGQHIAQVNQHVCDYLSQMVDLATQALASPTPTLAVVQSAIQESEDDLENSQSFKPGASVASSVEALEEESALRDESDEHDLAVSDLEDKQKVAGGSIEAPSQSSDIEVPEVTQPQKPEPIVTAIKEDMGPQPKVQRPPLDKKAAFRGVSPLKFSDDHLVDKRLVTQGRAFWERIALKESKQAEEATKTNIRRNKI